MGCLTCCIDTSVSRPGPINISLPLVYFWRKREQMVSFLRRKRLRDSQNGSLTEDQLQAWITVQSSAFESGSSRVGSRGRTEFGGRVTSSGLTATEMLWSSSASEIVLPTRSSPKSLITLVGWGFLLPNAYLALARSSLAIAILIDGHS
jgi:hypothetical protein